MHLTLAESIDVLLPNLVPKLVAPDRVLGLKVLADNLAPILRGGFECRLSTDVSQVDFQQCIVPDESELTLLQEQISAVTSGDGALTDAGWLQLQDFFAQWQLCLKSIPEIWLEFDVNNSSVFLPLPAIFFGLPQEVSLAIETHAIAAKSLNILLGYSGWHEWQDNLGNYTCTIRSAIAKVSRQPL